jgi:hypothetical protein
MPFKPGNKLGQGRPPGKVNRSTEQAKLTLARLANRGLDNITEDLDKIRQENPIKAAELYLKLLEFVIPKLKSVDLNATMEIDQRIQTINVNINKSGTDD